VPARRRGVVGHRGVLREEPPRAPTCRAGERCLSLKAAPFVCWLEDLTLEVLTGGCVIWWAGRKEQWEQLGVASGEPRVDLRDPDGGGVPEQLRRRPVPLRRGEALLLLEPPMEFLSGWNFVATTCKFPELRPQNL
jgi:hypothetical protein